MFAKLRELSKNLAIYGLGDVCHPDRQLPLLGVFVQYLSKEDYGILALLGSVEAVTKLFFRWGVDGSFMRFWYDCADDRARQRLASTLFFFLLATNGLLLAGAVAISPWLSVWLGAAGYTLALQLVLLNTFAIGFTFIPFHVLRMQQRAREFSVLAFARSASTLVLRLAARRRLRLRRHGHRRRRPRGHGGPDGGDGAVVRPAHPAGLLAAVLRESLAFGLPRVPHGFALQVIAVGDKIILTFFVSLPQIGLYAMGVSVGLIPKILLAAFEYAWAPFYYATVREPGAERIFSAVTTYGVAILALMTAGLSAIAADLLDRRHARTVHGRRRSGRMDVARRVLPGRLPADVDRAEHHEANRVLSGRDGYLGRAQHRPERAAHPALRHHRRRVCQRRRLCGAGGDRVSLFAALLPDPLRNRTAGTGGRSRHRGLRRGSGAAGDAPGVRRARPGNDGGHRDDRAASGLVGSFVPRSCASSSGSAAHAAQPAAR